MQDVENPQGYLRRKSTLTVTWEDAGLPSTIAGEYFHFLTESTAAWRRGMGPLTAFASTTLPRESICAETTTLPWTLDCLAAPGYTGRVEEISLASCIVLTAGAVVLADVALAAGAVTAGANAGAGGAGWFGVRATAGSIPVAGISPAASSGARSGAEAVCCARFPRLSLGAFGDFIFKFGIAGCEDTGKSACFEPLTVLSCRRSPTGPAPSGFSVARPGVAAVEGCV